jgi:uncharacterized protein
MLRANFEIFDGVGPGTSQKLQDVGIMTWDDALRSSGSVPMSAKRAERFLKEVASAKSQFEAGHPCHFDRLLKPKEAWRLFSSFADRCVCFDIETTGLSPEDDDITIITTYRPAARKFGVFVKGQNLAEFPSTLKPGDVLVGFNNRAFDTPFIVNTFGDQLPRTAQADVRWILYAMGIKGPLKVIEQEEFGIVRPAQIHGFSGDEAVVEWYRWTRTKDPKILRRLLLYSAADTFVLDYLARESCRRNGCARFQDKVATHALFQTEHPEDWCTCLPPVPPLPDRSNPRQHAIADPEEEESAESLRESHYENIFLMALSDEMISRQERRVLDLFAAKYGLSQRVQEEIEHRARDAHQRRGGDVLVERVLAMSDEWQKWYLTELAMFSWVDGTLDRREHEILREIALKIGTPESEIGRMKEEATELGKALSYA